MMNFKATRSSSKGKASHPSNGPRCAANTEPSCEEQSALRNSNQEGAITHPGTRHLQPRLSSFLIFPELAFDVQFQRKWVPSSKERILLERLQRFCPGERLRIRIVPSGQQNAYFDPQPFLRVTAPSRSAVRGLKVPQPSAQVIPCSIGAGPMTGSNSTRAENSSGRDTAACALDAE
jgi:hypothetical protein